MNDYFYDWGWDYNDNKDTAYRTGMKVNHYRVFKHFKNGSIEAVTDVMPREEAIKQCKQIQLLDPQGQMDWVDRWHEAEEDRREQRNAYLRSKERL